MGYPYSICPTGSSGVILNGVYYYPAEHCFFHHPTTLMSESPVETFGCSATNPACHPAVLTANRVSSDDHLSRRLGGAGFRLGSRLPEEGLRSTGGPTPTNAEPEPLGTREETAIYPLFHRDYRVHFPEVGDFRYIIRVFYCAFRGRHDNPRQEITIRGIGHEIAAVASGHEPVLVPFFIAPSLLYADMVVEGREDVPIDVLTYHDLTP